LNENKGYIFSKKCETNAFFYQRRNRPFRIINGDYTADFEPINTIGEFLKQNVDRKLISDDVINFYKEKLKNINF